MNRIVHGEVQENLAAIEELAAKAGIAKRVVARSNGPYLCIGLDAKVGARLRTRWTPRPLPRPKAMRWSRRSRRTGKGVAGRSVRMRRKSLASTTKHYVSASPRAGPGRAGTAGSPRIRRDPADHHRDRRAATHPRFGSLHPGETAALVTITLAD